MLAWTAGLPRSVAFRLNAANRRIVGAALGSIIAAIITHHITSTSRKYAGDQTDGAGMAMPAPASR
jgi:hypothetical protein